MYNFSLMEKDDIVLETKGLKKTFVTNKGKTQVEAVKGINLKVNKGKIFGFLGPNGAGKTTSLSMLTTLLVPTGGDATVVGFDLLKEPEKIREYIGYVSQSGGVDMSANAEDNLILQARLHGASGDVAKKRASELIKQFELSEFAERKTTSYSGGQKRRLDLALGMVHRPKLIFLDEPTTGLDPQSRAHFWEEIRRVKTAGVTIFLTTHYLDEADNLCDYLAIIDQGTIVAEGSPTQLKRQIGRESIIIGFKDMKDLEQAKSLLGKQSYILKLRSEENKLHLYVKDGEKLLVDVLHLLDNHAVEMHSIELAKPSLDDVFLEKTGRSLREEGS